MWPFVRSLTLLACLLLARAAPAGVAGWSGLGAVAVSPDGKRLAVGGQNRVIYLVDAGTLEVERRLYFGVRIGELHFARGERFEGVADGVGHVGCPPVGVGRGGGNVRHTPAREKDSSGYCGDVVHVHNSPDGCTYGPCGSRLGHGCRSRT